MDLAEDERRTAPVAEEPLWRAYLRFLGPMVLANILQALSGTINNVFLGQMLGVRALAAVSGFFPIQFFFIAFIIGLGAGASVLVGQAWGARQPERIKAVAGSAGTVTFLGGLVVAALGIAFARQLLQALGTPPDILEPAVDYAHIVLISLPALFIFLLWTSMLRGVGDTVTPLIALGVSTGVGLVLTPLLIKGWIGLPPMGVRSGAIANVVSTAVTLSWLAWRLRSRAHPLAPDGAVLAHLKPDPGLLKLILRIGLPGGVQMIVVSLSEVAVLFLVNRFGSGATAAYGAVNQVMSYVQFPAISISITASVLAAQAIGAGRNERLGPITRTGYAMNGVLTGGLIALAYLLSRPLIGLFIKTPEVTEMALTLLHIILWSTVIFGLAGVTAAVMRASGEVMIPTGISIFSIAVIQVPLSWFLSLKMGINGVWVAYPVAFCCMFALQAAYYRLVWMRKEIVRLI
jgi:putative MATE family efflux protein